MENILKWNNKLITFNDSYIRPDIWIPPKPLWPTDSLEGRWRLESDLNDSVNSNNFSVFAGSENYAAGADGDALTWNNDSIYYFDNATWAGNIFNGTPNWSVCFWHKAVTNDNSRTIWGVSKITSVPNVQYCRAMTHTQLTAFEINIKTPTENPGGYIEVTNSMLAWHHYIITYDGANMKIYQDNTYEGAGSSATSAQADMRYFWINPECLAATSVPEAAMQNLYAYSKELTSDERATLYNSGTPI